MIEWIKLAVSVVALIFSIGTFFYVQRDKKERASAKALDDFKREVNEKLTKKCDRITRLETEIGRIPTRAEFEAAQERGRKEIVRIHERIDEINEGIKNSQLMLGELIGITKGAKHG